MVTNKWLSINIGRLVESYVCYRLKVKPKSSGVFMSSYGVQFGISCSAVSSLTDSSSPSCSSSSSCKHKKHYNVYISHDAVWNTSALLMQRENQKWLCIYQVQACMFLSHSHPFLSQSWFLIPVCSTNCRDLPCVHKWVYKYRISSVFEF